MLIIALAAAPVTSLLGILPHSYIVALAGLAILPSFQDALERAFGGTLRFGSIVSFLVAATPFTILGITSAFWALVAGVVVAFLTDRAQLLSHWRGEHVQRSEERRSVLVRRAWTARVAGDLRVQLQATIRNISVGGLLVHCEQQLLPGVSNWSSGSRRRAAPSCACAPTCATSSTACSSRTTSGKRAANSAKPTPRRASIWCASS